MNRVTLLLAVVLLCGGAQLWAGGAQEKPEVSAGPVEVTWLAHPVLWTVTGEGDLAAKYQKDHPNVKITPALYSVDVVREKAMIEISSGSGEFDIISLANNIYRTDLGGNAFVDLKNKFKEIPDFDDFSKGFVDMFKADDGVYGALPMRSGLATTLFRKDLFDKYALPSPQSKPYAIPTFIANAQKLTLDTNGDGVTDVYGFSFKGKEGSQMVDDLETWLYAFGGRIVDDKTRKATINTPASIEAVQHMIDMVHKYKVCPPGTFSYTSTEEATLIKEGKSAQADHWWNYAAQYNNPKDSKVAGSIALGYVPEKVGAGLGYGHGGGWGMFLNKKSKKNAAAWEWMKFVTNKENQVYELVRGNGPTRISVFATKEFAEAAAGAAGAKIVADYYAAIKIPPPFPEWVQVREIAAKHYSLALNNAKTAKQAMDDAAKEIDALTQKK